MKQETKLSIIRIFAITIALMTTIMGAVSLFGGNDLPETMYIASEGPTAQAYKVSEGELQEAETLPRGTEVLRTDDAYTDEKAGTLWKVQAGPETYFVSSGNLSYAKDDVVLEKKVYVRTPATIYKTSEGCSIAGFAPKGTALEITGCDRIGADGRVNKYAVRSGDTEGYVYGKYMAFTREEAEKKCNDKGAYDMAKEAKYPVDLHGGKATKLDYFPYERRKIKGNEFCSDARGIYLHAGALAKDKYFELAKDSGVNAVVINIDGGTLAYESLVAEKMCPTAYEHAKYSLEKYQKLVKRYNDAGFYTIGRIVCFNDEKYAKDHAGACIKTGGQRTKWVSAYDRGAWEYKVSLACEAVELMGFREIQFDYVRFPERSYEMSAAPDTDFRNKYGEEKAQAIQNFCFYAADQIHEAGAYFSVDVFGECSNGYVCAYGQYWPAISNIVDAISSMPYTDHQGGEGTWEDPYGTIYSWAKKSARMQEHIPTPAIARTWITGYDTPYWAPSVDYDYGKLKAQVKALEDAGLDGGFIPWNSSSSYGKYKEYKKIWEK